MPRIITSRAFIVRWTRMLHSIGRLSASASSHHSLSLAVFITNIAESDFRHTQQYPSGRPLEAAWYEQNDPAFCPSAAHHLDGRFAPSFRGDPVSLRAATQTPRRHIGVRGREVSRRSLHVRYDVCGITIVAVPIRTIVAVPRRTDPYPARAGLIPKTRHRGGVADARRYRDPCRLSDRRADYWGSKSSTK